LHKNSKKAGHGIKKTLFLQSDEIPKQAIGKDYLHGIKWFHQIEFPFNPY